MTRSGWLVAAAAAAVAVATVTNSYVTVRAQQAPAAYVGSTECRAFHPTIYDRWKNTRMANVVRDPKEQPDAIIPDLSKPNPLVTFTKDQIAWVYGSKWKQRYLTKVGDDYFPLG